MPSDETTRTANSHSLEAHYDAYYFEHSCGLPYRRDDHWLAFFGRIADRIAEDIAPASVLDAGCAMGFLVEALRDRGTEAYGLDVSEYALGLVRDDVRDYCWQASITDPLKRDYDLIVCMEVLEHLTAPESELAIDNLCAHGNEILFSSTPTDFHEPSHQNVRPTAHWAVAFARRGFLPDAAYDASYIVPWARRFRRTGLGVPDALAAYEQQLTRLDDENRTVRGELMRRSDEVAQQATALTQAGVELAQKEVELTQVREELAHQEADLTQAREELQTARTETAVVREDACGRIAVLEAELLAMTRTLTFRATKRPRAVYGRLRRRGKDERAPVDADPGMDSGQQ